MPNAAREALAATRAWVEGAVIGLNLCPFAKRVVDRSLVRYACSSAVAVDALLHDLLREARALSDTPEDALDTTLLVHPHVLRDFRDYNDFLAVAEAALLEVGLRGTLQLASFHPEYRFAGTRADDVTNFTNRSPYPMLHLLRESSVSRAIASGPDARQICERNISTMRRLGHSGVAALGIEPPGTTTPGASQAHRSDTMAQS